MEKRILLRFLFAVVFTVSIYSCKSTTPNLIGTWVADKNADYKMNITNLEGNTYHVYFPNFFGSGSKSLLFKYKDGSFISTGNNDVLDIKFRYSKEKDKLIDVTNVLREFEYSRIVK